MRDKLMKALVLFLIGAFSGLSIFGVNQLTYKKIEENIRLKEEGFYKELFGLGEDKDISFTELTIEDGFYEIEIVSDGVVVGYVYKGTDNNNYGKVTTLVGITEGKVSNVVISDSNNTPNFIKKIENGYLDPFSGQDTDNVSFDTKTGASYTYGSVSETVVKATDYYNTERSDD